MSKTKFNKTIPKSVVTKSTATLFKAIESWLDARQLLLTGLILFIAIAFRIIYFIQLNNGPCIWQHKFVDSDMHFYDSWAKIIAKGDWLSNRSFHQYDASHRWIADYYFKTHPEEAARLQQQIGNDKSPDALGKLLWQRWDGGKIYHQDPLYIYIVAVIYKTTGDDVRHVFVLQMILGVFSVLLVYLISRRHFGNTAALASGIMAAFCGPMMFYELVLVRESMIVFAGLLLVYLMDKTFETGSVKNFILLGATVACCILLKSVFFLFLLLTIALLVFIYRSQFRLLTVYTGSFLMGVIIMYSPLLIRNAIVGVPLISQNAIGSIASIASSDVNYDPVQSYVLNLANATTILEKTGGKTMPAFISSVQTHPNAISYLKLVLKKAALVFHWYEFPNNKNFYYYRIHAPILWFTFVNMLIIAPLGIVGLLVAIFQRKKLWSIYLLLLMHFLLLVVFIVLSRYRIPFEVTLILFAGFAVSEILRNAQVNLKLTLLMSGGVLAAAIFVGRSLPEGITKIRGVDYQQPYNFYYQQLIDKKLAEKDIVGALQCMTEFMELEPDDVKNINMNSVDLNSYQLVLVKVYAEFHEIFSNLYKLAGDTANSANEQLRAKELKDISLMYDQSGSAESILMRAAKAEGEQKLTLLRAAVQSASTDIKVNPNNSDAYLLLKTAYENLGITDSAIFVMHQLLKIDSNNFYAAFHLGTLYGRYKNDFGQAIYYLEKARSLQPENEDVHINLGIVYGMAQQNDKAIEMMRKAAAINPDNMNNLKNLEMLLRRLGRNAEADEVKKKIQG